VFEQVLDLVGQPPGSLVYHFIILFAVEAAFAISIGQWMRERDTSTARLTAGIFAVLVARVLVLLASLAAFAGYFPRNVLIPPVERGVDAITILALSWAFTTMDDPDLLDRNFLPDLLTGLGLGIILVGAAGTFYYWLTTVGGGALFNGSWLDAAWSVGHIAFASVGLVWMVGRIRYIYDPFLKGLMLLLLGTAAAIQIIDPTFGDVPASMRVGLLVTMPMLAAVAYRHVVEQLLHWDDFEPRAWSSQIEDIEIRTPPSPVSPVPAAASSNGGMSTPIPPPGKIEPESVDSPLPAPEPTQKAKRVQEEHLPPPVELLDTASIQPEQATDLDVLDVVESLGGLFGSLEEREMARQVPRTIASALRADMCALVVVGNNMQDAGIVGGYDNITQDYLPLAVLDLSKHPTLVSSLDRLRQMRLSMQRNRREIRDIFDKLDITHDGPIYIQPLTNDDDQFGVILVGSPYSGRNLSNMERNLLDRLAPLTTAALLNSERYQDLKETVEGKLGEDSVRLVELQDELTATKAELSASERQTEEMKAYIRDMHRQLEAMPQQEMVDELQQEAETLRQRLNAEQQTLAVLQERAANSGELEQQMQQQVEKSKTLDKELQELRHEAERANARAQEYHTEIERLRARQSALAAGRTAEEEFDASARTEIASLRARLAEASINRQEISFLQEQLASKAREAVLLQTQLIEAQAVAEALSAQIKGADGTSGLKVLEAQFREQEAEIRDLKAQLNEAQTLADMNAEAHQAQADAEQVDREAVAQLEAQLAERSAMTEALEAQLREKSEAIAELKGHMTEISGSLQNLERQLTFKTEEVARLQESLADTRQRARDRINELQTRLAQGYDQQTEVDEAEARELEAELAEKQEAVNVLEEQLANARNAIDKLEQQLTATNNAVNEAIADAGQIDSHDEVIASIAQELRTPMSSIMGYTELLLKESVGILGSLQRKFLQRVKSNTERMGSLLDDLIRITVIDLGRLELRLTQFDVQPVLETAIGKVMSQFRDKGLVLRMAVASDLPPMTADREALEQVIGHLLSNAGLATPIGGEVQLTIRGEDERVPAADGGDVSAYCLHIAVEDSGVGIAEEDIDRVFTRQYKAESPLIEGLGDTGVSLALAKSLVDAQGGRIWVETLDESGTVIHIVLPFEPPGGAT